MERGFTGKLVRRLALAGVLATAGVMALAWFYVRTTGITMGGHGWVALFVGTVISFLVSGILTTVLVLGGQNGTDDAANEIEWE